MAKSKPSMVPGGDPGSLGSAESAIGAPTQEPPAAAARGGSDCGCKGAQAGVAAAGAVPTGALEAASMAAPSMLPGALAGAAVSAVWRNNVHVTGLWSINQDRNCWAYIDNGVGWRKLSAASESGLVSLNMLASHAYEKNAAMNAYEENDGSISQMYVW